MPIYLTINLSVYQPINLSLCLPVFVCLSAYQSAFLFIYCSIALSIYPSIFIYLCFHPSVHPFIHPSIHLMIYFYLSIRMQHLQYTARRTVYGAWSLFTNQEMRPWKMMASYTCDHTKVQTPLQKQGKIIKNGRMGLIDIYHSIVRGFLLVLSQKSSLEP